jgi:hypothetical protein
VVDGEGVFAAEVKERGRVPASNWTMPPRPRADLAEFDGDFHDGRDLLGRWAAQRGDGAGVATLYRPVARGNNVTCRAPFCSSPSKRGEEEEKPCACTDIDTPTRGR